jgi:hypothetical protein
MRLASAVGDPRPREGPRAQATIVAADMLARGLANCTACADGSDNYSMARRGQTRAACHSAPLVSGPIGILHTSEDGRGVMAARPSYRRYAAMAAADVIVLLVAHPTKMLERELFGAHRSQTLAVVRTLLNPCCVPFPGPVRGFLSLRLPPRDYSHRAILVPKRVPWLRQGSGRAEAAKREVPISRVRPQLPYRSARLCMHSGQFV